MPWVVLADPEGNEFCVLEPRPEYAGGGAGRLAAIVVDALRPGALAPFWRAASGWQPLAGLTDAEGVRLAGPAGGPPYLELVAVPGAKVAKNRVHLDVVPRRGRPAPTRSAAYSRRAPGPPTSARARTFPGWCWPTQRATSCASSPRTTPRDCRGTAVAVGWGE